MILDKLNKFVKEHLIINKDVIVNVKIDLHTSFQSSVRESRNEDFRQSKLCINQRILLWIKNAKVNDIEIELDSKSETLI